MSTEATSAPAIPTSVRIAVEGEAVPRLVRFRDPHEIVVGRDAQASVRLAHDAVSRRHLRLFVRDGRWFAEDLGSRHGTTVDGVLLAPRRPVPIGEHATVVVRPFALRVEIGGGSDSASNAQNGVLPPAAADVPVAAPPSSIGSHHDPESVVRSLDAGELDQLNGRRLTLLLEAAEAIHAARDERGIAEAATDALLAGTGFARVIFLRWAGDVDTLETLAVRTSADSDAAPSARISRTLLRAAADGRMVMLEDQVPLREAESIIGAGVAAALCAPVVAPPLLEGFIYLDSQRRSARPSADAATFCHLVAKVSGLAIASLRRQGAEQRHRELEHQLQAARRAQQRLLPADRGIIGPLRWRLYSRPGLVVAGDIAGVHERNESITLFVGDVRGKGVDAAIIMSVVASHLAASLSEDMPLEKAVSRVGAFVHAHRRDDSDFVSLFAVQIDRTRGVMRTVDAGHGLALRMCDDRVEMIASEGGLVLGISPDVEYEASELPWQAGDRLVLFTDGVNEQCAAEGDQMLGVQRIMGAVAGAATADLVIERISALLEGHAGGEVFADDVTMLAVEL